jgi:flagellar hook-basal body complex protein FliE
MSTSGIGGGSAMMEKIANTLKDMQNDSQKMMRDSQQKPAQGMSFMDHLRSGVDEVNAKQKTADTMAVQLASGKTENIHETMLAATQAELSFNLMVQMRNKALEAYTEIMRMPV